MSEQHRVRIVLLLGVLLVLPALLWAAYVALGVATVGERDDQRPADAVVVLGTREYSGWPSRSFSTLFDHALYLYEEGMAPVVIVAGGGKMINPRLSFMYNPSPKGRSKLFSPLNEIYDTIAELVSLQYGLAIGLPSPKVSGLASSNVLA